MSDAREGMLSFLGASADQRLLGEDRVNLPEAEQRYEPAISTHQHDRLVAAGSLLTAITLIGGVAMALYGAWRLLFEGGGGLDGALLGVGIVLAATHWGWVHVAEYAGVTIDDRQRRTIDEGGADWLAGVEPYPRFSVRTSVLDDASTRVQRILHRPVIVPGRPTFTFVSEPDSETIIDAHASAAEIAGTVETMRREARLETDRLQELWEAASSAYEAARLNAEDDEKQLAGQRAAAIALSEHINAALLEPPLVE
jgi:hypothetical protein